MRTTRDFTWSPSDGRGATMCAMKTTRKPRNTNRELVTDLPPKKSSRSRRAKITRGKGDTIIVRANAPAQRDNTAVARKIPATSCERIGSYVARLGGFVDTQRAPAVWP